ncbi:hypothetical protein COF75_22650 [Bacillus toyonensis]|nr:hypothetical protein CN594_26510 [Bacillus toyonensis]PEO51241.1 hypothetical protein CN579_28495 [Bacillus toyonensis]PGD22103.1 hypothetical protein COM37_11140 [Bacillus toyonensis]PHD42655.1 hypothetical protein COF75_22650 [Bacillus toyonensis]
MKMLYFNIENGECVPAFTCLPSHRAKITGSKIHSIETCFNVSNITRNGYDWFLNNVEEENESWAKKHPHLMRSLKRLALSQSIRHPFKYSNFEPSNHRFPFVLVWSKDKKFTKAYFK